MKLITELPYDLYEKIKETISNSKEEELSRPIIGMQGPVKAVSLGNDQLIAMYYRVQPDEIGKDKLLLIPPQSLLHEGIASPLVSFSLAEVASKTSWKKDESGNDVTYRLTVEMSKIGGVPVGATFFPLLIQILELAREIEAKGYEYTLWEEDLVS